MIVFGTEIIFDYLADDGRTEVRRLRFDHISCSDEWTLWGWDLNRLETVGLLFARINPTSVIVLKGPR